MLWIQKIQKHNIITNNQKKVQSLRFGFWETTLENERKIGNLNRTKQKTLFLTDLYELIVSRFKLSLRFLSSCRPLTFSFMITSHYRLFKEYYVGKENVC